MGVGELIEQIRSLYVSRLQQALAARVTLQAEPVALPQLDIAKPRGVRSLPTRDDGVEALATGGEAPFTVDSEGVLGFEPVSFAWGEDLSVQLLPFCWDFVEFEVPSAGLKNLVENLGDWHERWFTSPSAGKEPAAGATPELAGVLHALSAVDKQGESSLFQVDFGSAPVACFEDLLDVLAASRANSVTIREAI